MNAPRARRVERVHRLARLERIHAQAYTVPTDGPESDGTLEWDSTTIVVVSATAGGLTGLGYSYTDATAAQIVRDRLAPRIASLDAGDVRRAWDVMTASVRNIGRPGVAAGAISAVDIALWDLKARLLDVAVVDLLGRARDAVPVYGSGGFTSYSPERLAAQLGEWVSGGIGAVKMKVGREPGEDRSRVIAARGAIGKASLFVDAHGAYSRAVGLAMADLFAESGVIWFEEPVSSDDLEGLRLLRERAPAGMEIAAGEYGYDPWYFRRMLSAGAVDVLQADATRCLGITGFMQAAALCEAFHVPLSSHTAPAVHAHACCATPVARNVEWFHDHVRIESMLFDGAPELIKGSIAPDGSRPGLGLEIKEADARAYAVGHAA